MSGTAAKPSNEDVFERWTGAVGEVAAPILAGFSFTAVIIVTDDAVNFRWPGAVILTLTIATLLLILAIQGSGQARMHFSSKAEEPEAAAFRADQGRKWAVRSRLCHQWGLVALLAGLGSALAPLHGGGAEGNLRWCASIAAFAACVLQGIYISTHLHAPLD
jgi:hypothetical protein